MPPMPATGKSPRRCTQRDGGSASFAHLTIAPAAKEKVACLAVVVTAAVMVAIVAAALVLASGASTQAQAASLQSTATAQAAPAAPEVSVAPGAPAAPLAPASEGPAIGSVEAFWVMDWGTSSYKRIDAAVRFVGEHTVIYVHTRALVSESTVTTLGTAFDTVVYPAVTEAYGPEPDPGIDGDPRVAILIYDFYNQAIEGSFNPRDIQPDGSEVSNRREMFYLNQQAVIYEPQNAGALAAHEFAHLVLHYRDTMLDPSPYAAPEVEWLTEGFTTYAEHISGYDTRVGSQLRAFTSEPDTSLTRWMGFRANYGASYAFMRYLGDRFGPEFIRALIEEPLDGAAGLNAALRTFDSFQSFPTVFDDWVVANFLDTRPPANPPYVYNDLSVAATPVALTGPAPLLGTSTVKDYAAAYLDFPATAREAAFQAVVDGTDGAPLQAALISWDSDGLMYPLVQRFDLANSAAGDTVTSPKGYDRHTLVVWARGTVGSAASYEFRYSGCADPPAGVQFLDMSGSDHFYEYAALLLSLGVISGREVPEGSGLWFFAGKENVTRAQFAKMVMEAIGLHTAGIEGLDDPTFKDVRPVYKQGQPEVYPFDYIEEAAALGIVTGFSDGYFRPYRAITRTQLVLMIVRGAAAAGAPLPLYEGDERVFVDVIPSHPRYREIMTAYSAGILSGSLVNGRLYFYPDSSASRNHVAKMTANLVGHIEGYVSPEPGDTLPEP